MFKSTSTKLILVIIASVFMLTACDRSKDKAVDTSVLSAGDTILRYVPADTPYVVANVEPLADDLMDKLEPKVDRLLQSYQTLLREVLAVKGQELSDDERNSEKYQRASAVINELMTMLSIDGIREAGIARNATSVFYGNGLLPVARVELSDAAAFESTLSRLEEKAGQKLDVITIGDNSLRFIDADKVKIVIGIDESKRIVT
ncbi:MAG: hypothetical protein OEM51_06880, partial [Gammaproteobacteria bacterium]|nr:hypothetical protein [Gammaproteobacteria bacterium]